jgi:hypothetical protein
LTFVLLDNVIDREYCNCKYIIESNFQNDNFFIGFLSLSLLEMPTHVLIGNVKQKSFVNLFTRRRKEKRKKETIYAIIWLRGVEGKKFLNTPTVLWPAHTMVGHKLKFFSEKRSLFSNHHRIISFSIQYRAVWRKWTPVKKNEKKMFSAKEKKGWPAYFLYFLKSTICCSKMTVH